MSVDGRPVSYHKEWRCRLRLKMERTSPTNLNASSIGSKFSSAVSDGSANQDLIGMALSAAAIWGRFVNTWRVRQRSC